MAVPSKQANVYNIEQINKESRREIILQNILAAKVVMMIEEEGNRNFMSHNYQALHL